MKLLCTDQDCVSPTPIPCLCQNAFSLTIDERFTLKPGLWYMMQWLLGAKVQWNTVITRQVSPRHRWAHSRGHSCS